MKTLLQSLVLDGAVNGVPEVWLPCFRHETDYVVSNFGRVARLKPDGSLRVHRLKHLDAAGHPDIVLKSSEVASKGHKCRVCVLVAVAFLGAKIGVKIRHKDGNKRNNSADNLICSDEAEVNHSLICKQTDLTHEMVLSELVYFPGAGDFYRRSETQKFIGWSDPAYGDCGGKRGNPKTCQVISNPYQEKPHFVVHLFAVRIAASRLALFYTHGEWPVGRVTHIDGDTLNCRLANLRQRTEVADA